MMRSKILSTGRAEASKLVENADFTNNLFMRPDGTKIDKDPQLIVDKLEAISGIQRRRYIGDDEDAITLAAQAANNAIISSGIDKEEIGAIILGHNFGLVKKGTSQTALLPNLAALVKHSVGIENPDCIAYDLLFGCPGWLEAYIQGHRMIALGDAKYVLVIGVEVISPILDKHDLDSMLFADGAGAAILGGTEDSAEGMMTYKTYSHCQEEVDYIKMMPSYNPELTAFDGIHPKIIGRQVYKYAVNYVPQLIIDSMKKANIGIEDVSLFLLHQANAKMNMAMGQRLLKHFDVSLDLEDVMPIIVQDIGNSSVATIPTLLDKVWRSELEKYNLSKGDIIVMASVGAGMHANCVITKI